VTCKRQAVADDGNRPLGEAVAGVRFKAWQPASGLHRPSGSCPLTFDLIDTWNGRSLGGCVYHVAHPGDAATIPNRSNSTRPSAAAGPLQDHGHTPGKIDPPREERTIDIPFDPRLEDASCIEMSWAGEMRDGGTGRQG